MKQLALIILCFLFCVQAMAQQPQQPHKPHDLHRPHKLHDKNRIHAIKVGFITDRLDLTSKEAEAFWPIYNSYEKESRELWHAYKKKYPNQFRQARDRYINKADEQKTKDYLNGEQEFKEQKLELRRKYKDRFLKVISATQVAALYQAEADFREMLIRQVKHHTDDRPRSRR